MLPLATITYSSGGSACGSLASIASRVRRAASSCARPASSAAQRRRAARPRRALRIGSIPRRRRPRRSPAGCFPSRDRRAQRRGRSRSRAVSASTRRFARDSGPNRCRRPRTAARRPARRWTVEWRAMKSSTGSTIASAKRRARSTASRRSAVPGRTGFPGARPAFRQRNVRRRPPNQRTLSAEKSVYPDELPFLRTRRAVHRMACPLSQIAKQRMWFMKRILWLFSWFASAFAR